MDVRITKYNPKYRSPDGFYTREEWQHISDVWDCKTVTLDEYLRIEHGYWLVLKSMLTSIGIAEVEIVTAEKPRSEKELLREYQGHPFFNFTMESRAHFQRIKPKPGKVIAIGEIEYLLKGCLRGDFWVAMNFAGGGYIRFGYDMYMYLGYNGDFSWIDQEGIFVEVDPEGSFTRKIWFEEEED